MIKYIVSLTIILTLSFTACGSGDKSDVNTPLVQVYTSPYLEKVDSVECNPSNLEVQFIDNDDDWSHINNPDKKIFCVSPGDYVNAGTVVLTTSGTENDKRYIVLNNGNDLHPAKLSKDEIARVRLRFIDTNYWVIDRMSYWESLDTINPITFMNSHNNIINRHFLKNVGNGIYLYPGSDNNTIQQCRIERDNINVNYDRAAIGLYDHQESNISIKNTKVLNNEIYNFVDGFQAIRMGTLNLNYEGTIVDYNHIYIDNTIYTDCAGNHDINGECAYAENAIDLKAGSNNPNNPMIISNNTMWGYKKSDITNSSLSDPGAAVVVHFGTKNVQLVNNTIFNSDVGLSINAAKDEDYAFEDSQITNNIFNNIKEHVIYIAESKNISMANNKFENMIQTGSWGSQYWFVGYDLINMSIQNNELYNLQNRTAKGSNITAYTDNQFFDADPGNIPYDSSNIILQDDSDFNYEDIIIETDKFTNQVKTVLLENSVSRK